MTFRTVVLLSVLKIGCLFICHAKTSAERGYMRFCLTYIYVWCFEFNISFSLLQLSAPLQCLSGKPVLRHLCGEKTGGEGAEKALSCYGNGFLRVRKGLYGSVIKPVS